MLEFAQFSALGVSVVSFCLSLTAVLIHYAKRGENVQTAHLEAAIQALQLAQVDVIDHIETWTKRDRTRRLRAEKIVADDDQVVMQEPQGKDGLRARARAMGVVR